MASIPRIAIVISHPIQHFCPQYASLARLDNIKLKVFFASTLGFKKYVDPNFKQEISWDNLYMDEFDHVFLNEGKTLAADKTLDAPELDNALEEYKPDLVIVHGYFQKYQRRAYAWARKNNIRIAYISDSERRQKRNPLKEILKYFFIRKYFSGIDYFLSVGDANEFFYKHYGVASGKIIRMHFSIDLRYYEKKYECRKEMRKAIRSEYKIKDDELVLCVVGKLVPWKNQSDIIDAMKVLEQQAIKTHLFVLGSGTTMDLLKSKSQQLGNSEVYLPGFILPADLPSYYAASDIYVHPASVEPHSLAISEAIYMGVPVILSDRCGSFGDHDDVQENKNGLVYSFGNITELAEKILQLNQNKIQRSAFGEYSHEIAVRFQQRSHKGFVEELVKHLEL